MINKQISEELNNIFRIRQDSAYQDQKDRFNKAAKDIEFAKLYQNQRALSCEVSKRKALKQDYLSVEKELEEANKELNEYIKKNNIDLETHFVCPICKDTGYVDNHECKCRALEKINLLKKACALSPMPSFTFDDNKIEEYNVSQGSVITQLIKVLDTICNNFEHNKILNIFISGEVGVGKTFLASCVANKLLEKGIDVNYVTAFDFFRIIQAKQFNGDKNLADYYSTLFNSKMLIIDDLGSEPIYKNLSLEYLLSIIDSRISHGLKTMLISNLNQAQFAERYTERIQSRICDPAITLYSFIKGDDLRRIKK